MIINELSKGISHIEDLPISAFIKTVKHLHEYEVTEKVDGCVSANTRVLIKDNIGNIYITEIKNLENTFSDVKIYSYDFDTGNLIFSNILGFKRGISNKKWVKLTFDNGAELKLTEDHLVFTSNRNWVAASELLPDDIIFDFEKLDGK